MHILITGGTGFVGRPLTRYLLDRGHSVTTVGRSAKHPCDGQPGFQHIAADTTREGDWQNAAAHCQAVINLAGTTIFRRWSTTAKQDIRDSRILTTRHLVQAIAADQAAFLFSASGVGFYGDGGDQALTEDTAAGDDFLARLSIDWEKEAIRLLGKDTPGGGGRHAHRGWSGYPPPGCPRRHTEGIAWVVGGPGEGPTPYEGERTGPDRRPSWGPASRPLSNLVQAGLVADLVAILFDLLVDIVLIDQRIALDVDRLAKQEGISGQADFVHYTLDQKRLIAAELISILREHEIIGRTRGAEV